MVAAGIGGRDDVDAQDPEVVLRVSLRTADAIVPAVQLGLLKEIFCLLEHGAAKPVAAKIIHLDTESDEYDAELGQPLELA